MKWASLIVFAAILAACHAHRTRPPKRYDGYKVLQLTPVTNGHLELLRKLETNPEVDVWVESNRIGKPALVMVPPEMSSDMLAQAERSGMKPEVLNENVQQDIDEEKKAIEKIQRDTGKDFNYNSFNRYESIMAEMQSMLGRCPPALTCETYNIGQSVHGRELTVFKISKEGEGRQGVWLDSLIHAREWITGATVMKIMDTILTNYNTDSDVTALVDRYDWYFLPVMNPDGYMNSWEGERLWRKNMRPPEDDDLYECWGTDLNRNFDASWMTDGTADWQCLDTFGGPRAASESETVAIQAEARRLGSSLIAWVSVHSFSNLWLTSWGNTVDGWECALPDDYDDVFAVARDAAEAVMATHGTSWEYGSVCTVLYAASGATMDYVKASAGVKYTFTPELRGTNFVISPVEIQPSFEEVWNGVKAMVASIESRE